MVELTVVLISPLEVLSAFFNQFIARIHNLPLLPSTEHHQKKQEWSEYELFCCILFTYDLTFQVPVLSETCPKPCISLPGIVEKPTTTTASVQWEKVDS